jgi:hemoglobin
MDFEARQFIRTRMSADFRIDLNRNCPKTTIDDIFHAMHEGEIHAAIGEDGFERLIAAFYRQVPKDDILGPMYSSDLAGAEARLRDFLVGRFGGPQRYIEQRGHPRLRARHFPFAIDRAAAERWLALMDRAIDEAGLPAEVTTMLREYFAPTAAMLVNRP